METLATIVRDTWDNFYGRTAFFVALGGFPFFYALSQIVAMLPEVN